MYEDLNHVLYQVYKYIVSNYNYDSTENVTWNVISAVINMTKQ
jgi:hypothetical protein